jgi:methylase of polypeptide subunit release factors
MKTIKQSLESASRGFVGVGIKSPALDARLLLCHVLGVSVEHLVGYPEEEISEEQVGHFLELVERRKNREPIAKIIGSKEFWGREFFVNSHTLDPRPDSETLIEAVLNYSSSLPLAGGTEGGKALTGVFGLEEFTKRNKEAISKANELRKNSTDTEKKLWSHLRNKQLAGYKFRRQQSIGPFIVDFICNDNQLIIELDGGQHNESTNKEYDKWRTVYLESAGYHVMRFWNNEITENLEGAIEVILNFLHSPHPTSPHKREEGLKILDIGTGSGCLLITLLAEWPNASGVGVDISVDALVVARRNADALAIADRCEFVESDLLANIEGKFDIIVSNPPYIKTGDIAGLSREVSGYDPHLALDGGRDGLDCYRKLIEQLPDHLNEGGKIFVEIGEGQEEDLSRLFERNGFEIIEYKKDLAGIIRCLIAT